MEAVIPGKSVKLYSSMIKCLSKVGEELYMEALPDKLMLKTLNASRSAYFSFQLDLAFFDSYRISGNIVCVKVLLKPYQAVFRSLQNVEKCTMVIFEEDPRFILEMNCKLGVRKTFKLNLDLGNPINATYSKETSHHRFIVRPKLLQDCVANFAADVTEVSLHLSKSCVRMKSGESTTNDMDTPKKTLLTELTLDVNDFEKYELLPNSDPFDLIFSLREVHPILKFCEFTDQSVQIFTNGPGTPVIYSVKMYKLFDADFVLATLQGSTNNSTQSSQVSTTPSQYHNRSQHNSTSTSHPSSTPHFNHYMDGVKQTNRAVSPTASMKQTPSSNHIVASSHIQSNDNIMQVDNYNAMLDSGAIWTSDLLQRAKATTTSDDEAVHSDSE